MKVKLDRVNKIHLPNQKMKITEKNLKNVSRRTTTKSLKKFTTSIDENPLSLKDKG